MNYDEAKRSALETVTPRVGERRTLATGLMTKMPLEVVRVSGRDVRCLVGWDAPSGFLRLGEFFTVSDWLSLVKEGLLK